MQSTTRRTFLKQGAVAASTASALASPLLAQLGRVPEPIPPITDPLIKQLVQYGIDAAHSSGAVYADMRLTHLKRRRFATWKGADASVWNRTDQESMTVGIRALVDGYWGFASGPVWSREEVTRLGHMAVHIARTNALGKRRVVHLAPRAMVKEGHWIMPVKINPFDVNGDEVTDHLGAIYRYTHRFSQFGFPDLLMHGFCMIDKAFGSTDNSYYTQRTFLTEPDARFIYFKTPTETFMGNMSHVLAVSGRGWEMYTEQPIQEHLRRLYEELKEDASLPRKPVDVGRYDTVLDASTVASLVGSTVGAATQLDRVMGYEANAGGTSYINDPATMKGALKLGSPMLTVTANRDAVGGASTVKWDDEGVEPDPFTLVNEGVLTDFQTGRESAGWAREWDEGNTGQNTFRSHGCVGAPEAVDAPLIHNANLVMKPGDRAADIAELASDMQKGTVIKWGTVTMDFQQLNGYGRGSVYEVKDGKRVAALHGAGVLLRAPEFWKSLLAVGGVGSVKRYGLNAKKGQPGQVCSYSVDAAPVLVKDLTIIDRLRKA